MSKFDKIFEARETETVKEKENGNKEPAIKKSSGRKKDDKELKQMASVTSEPTTRSTNRTDTKRGRPPAKRSDPDFVGLTTYVRRDTHTRAKIALLQEGKGRELSELVEDLIYSWLNKK
jgi:hypothetical protein